MKHSKGITIVTLVITVLVLLIIVGVTISIQKSDEIIGYSQKVTGDYKITNTREKLLGLHNQWETVRDFELDLTFGEFLKNKFGKENIVYILDNSYNVNIDGIVLNINQNGEIKEAQEFEYVQDGLILMYDGIQNTRNGNNPQATTWEDISGNENDGTFINTTGSIRYLDEEKGYEFTNNSDYIQSTNVLGLSTDPNVTFEFVYKWYGLQTGQTQSGLFTVGYEGATDGRSLSHFFTSNDLWFITVNTRVTKGSRAQNENTIQNISFIKKTGGFNINNAEIYENCVKVSGTGPNTAMNFLDTEMQIGRAWQYGNQNRTLNGVICAVRVYNRALTQEELAQNFEADKERFNIQ